MVPTMYDLMRRFTRQSLTRAFKRSGSNVAWGRASGCSSQSACQHHGNGMQAGLAGGGPASQSRCAAP
jgi:hypothetical protein